MAGAGTPFYLKMVPSACCTVEQRQRRDETKTGKRMTMTRSRLARLYACHTLLVASLVLATTAPLRFLKT